VRRARIAFIVAAGAALLASKALAFDPATEAQNFSKTEERNYVVDASAILGDLAEEGWSGGQLSVTVVPEEGRPDSDDAEKRIHIRQVTVYVQNP